MCPFSSKLREDLFVCHVTGAQKCNLLCFSVGKIIRKLLLAVISNTSDNRTLTKQNLVSPLYVRIMHN